MLIVLQERTERTMQDETKINERELVMLDDDVVTLHGIARRVESTIGQSQLSNDIRCAADRLSVLLKGH